MFKFVKRPVNRLIGQVFDRVDNGSVSGTCLLDDKYLMSPIRIVPSVKSAPGFRDAYVMAGRQGRRVPGVRKVIGFKEPDKDVFGIASVDRAHRHPQRRVFDRIVGGDHFVEPVNVARVSAV